MLGESGLLFKLGIFTAFYKCSNVTPHTELSFPQDGHKKLDKNVLLEVNIPQVDSEKEKKKHHTSFSTWLPETDFI